MSLTWIWLNTFINLSMLVSVSQISAVVCPRPSPFAQYVTCLHPSFPLLTPSHISCATTPSPALLPSSHMSHAYTLPSSFSLQLICHTSTPFPPPSSTPYVTRLHPSLLLLPPPHISCTTIPFPPPPSTQYVTCLHPSLAYAIPSSYTLHP